jgi:saccharopine dehydrogenase-like NADP-dependent oxidoreductase
VKNILVFGAGRSSLFLVEYLSTYCDAQALELVVCDKDTSYAREHARVGAAVRFLEIDIRDTETVSALVASAELVVSLLPAALHIQIAGFCLLHKKNLATASYISDEMKALHEQVRDHGLLFLNECGLDPGIDHMSAMKMLDHIRKNGGDIIGFESYCGGLVADEDDGNNPWKYKFSWNPRNVVLAGQGAPALYLDNGKLRLVPYHQLFRHVKSFNIDGYGMLEGYPNRDSLKYRELYGLDHIEDMVRGTLRKTGYASAWQVFVDLGMTDDTTEVTWGDTSFSDWLNMYLPDSELGIRENLQKYTGCSGPELEKFDWLGFFGNEKLPLLKSTSAQQLEEILKIKWQLMPEDKDLVVMLHRITYRKNEEIFLDQATMVLTGESNTHTAMAKTVGLPLAIACKLILEGKIGAKGVMAPVLPEIYEPVLEELKGFGIDFMDHQAGSK